MWRYLTFVFCFASTLEDYSPNYFCADMNPQSTVIISQLMGMWYGVEELDHQDESHYVRPVQSCPIVHISEDHSVTTQNPLYRNTPYYGYGQGYAAGTSQYGKTQEQVNQELQQRAEYDRRTTYGNHPSRKLQPDYFNRNAQEHYLRMYLDENGDITEYHLRYNVTKPGFWISSGPDDGRNLEKHLIHYAGNVQVLKAVGDHMVLTICHQVPKRQLCSIILSREPKLDPVEIHSIHRMLNRKGLNTNSVKKLCNNSGSRFVLNSYLGLFLIVFFFYRILK